MQIRENGGAAQYMSGVVIPAADGGTLSRVATLFGDTWADGLTA
ncbi:hypothetical protein [Nocardia sp. CA-135398]